MRNTFIKVLLITCTFCTLPTWGLPTSGPKIDQHHVGLHNKTTGFVSIWVCPKCHPGMGPSVECGRIYDIERNKVDCVPCQEGISFSPNYDRGQCRPCTKCSDNENQIGKCTADKDGVTCKCKPGYYRETILTNDCKPCSYCCDDKSNKYEPDCNIQQVSAERRCSFQYDKQCTVKTTNSTKATSKGASTVTPYQTTPKLIIPVPPQKITEYSKPPTMPEPKGKNKANNTNYGSGYSKHISSESILFIAIISFFAVIAFGLILVFIYKRRKTNNAARSRRCDFVHLDTRTGTVQLFFNQRENAPYGQHREERYGLPLAHPPFERHGAERQGLPQDQPPVGQHGEERQGLLQDQPPVGQHGEERQGLLQDQPPVGQHGEERQGLLQDQPPVGQHGEERQGLLQDQPPVGQHGEERQGLLQDQPPVGQHGEERQGLLQDQPPVGQHGEERQGLLQDQPPVGQHGEERQGLLQDQPPVGQHGEERQGLLQDQPFPGQPGSLDALNRQANTCTRNKENKGLLANKKKSLICKKIGPKVGNIPYNVKHEVCLMLNVKQKEAGNDYHSVASNIGLNYYEVGNLARGENPMEGVFDVMISKAETVENFVDILFQIGRVDVVDKMCEIAEEHNKTS